MMRTGEPVVVGVSDLALSTADIKKPPEGVSVINKAGMVTAGAFRHAEMCSAHHCIDSV